MDRVAAHSRHLLQQLHEQRIQGLLCDCMLVVKGVCFKAHRNVLAAFSPYFRSLFQNSSGQKNDVFHLDIKNVSGIGQILDFMYTSHLDLTQDNIQVMLDTAQCLQVQNVLNLCHIFLRSTALDPPASVPCGGVLSLQSALTPDADCVVSAGYRPQPLHESSPDAQRSQVGEGRHPHTPPSASLHNSAGETPKQAPGALEGSCPELPFKQPSSYYKLRNFYSKQYYKRAACPSQERALEQPCAFSTPADLTAAENPPCAVSPPECVLESSEHLPANFLSQPLSESAPDPESGSPCPQPPKQMRLKKAVHLKKLNFLKSQKCAEQAAEPSSRDDGTRRVGPGSDSAPESACGRRTGDEEGEERGRPKDVRGAAQTERPEDAAASEDPSLALQSPRQYACELCGKPFKHPSNLELHKRSHTGEKPFECNLCGKHFSQAGNLQTHLRRHSGDKPYICEVCGKRFAASGDVQRHIIIHSGEKPHLCDICGRGFSNFSNLKEHKKTHTADKVFTCDECGKSFNMQRKLVKHRLRHTGERPHSCAACGKCFGGSGDLRRHVRTHTGEKPYTCEICSKCFTRSAVLRRHRKTHGKGGAPARDPRPPPGHAAEAPDPDGVHRSDSFSHGVPTTLMSVSAKLPVHPGENCATEVDSHSAGPCCKLRSMMQSDGVGSQEKLSLDAVKLAKPPPPAHPAYAYADVEAPAADEQLPPDGMSIIRSSLAALDNHCGDALSGRAPAAAYRNAEGQFFSSMTLWGLAMKTLQNEGELDQ